MYFLTTLLLVIFGIALWLGFFVAFHMVMGERKKWQIIYLVSLIALGLIIVLIIPNNYRSPFMEGDPTAKDIERGYVPEPQERSLFSY